MEDDKHLTSVRYYHPRCLRRAHEAYCLKSARTWYATSCTRTRHDGWYLLIMSHTSTWPQDRRLKQDCSVHWEWSHCVDICILPITHKEGHKARSSDSYGRPDWRNICAAEDINNFGHDVQVLFSNTSLPPRWFIYRVDAVRSQLTAGGPRT